MPSESVTHQSKEFAKVNYAEKVLRNREFYNCTFIACDFNKSDLRDNSFEDCIFENCNFSMTIIEGAGFRNAIFRGCKLLGMDFTRCNPFAFSFWFEDCRMDYSTFYGAKLKNTKFLNSMLTEVDFSQADLTSAIFDGSDLSGATFQQTNLEKADFRKATNFAIDPDANKMKKAKFSAHNLDGLLFKHQLDIDYEG